MKKCNKTDKKLIELNNAKVSSSDLLLMSFCRIPRSYEDIRCSLGMGYTVVLRTVKRHPKYLLKLQSRIISRERGKHPVEVVATPDAEKLLAMLFK